MKSIFKFEINTLAHHFLWKNIFMVTDKCLKKHLEIYHSGFLRRKLYPNGVVRRKCLQGYNGGEIV